MDSASRELEAITVSDRGIREYRECARVVWLSRDIMHFSGKNVHSRAFYIFAWNVKNTIVAIEDHNFVTYERDKVIYASSISSRKNSYPSFKFSGINYSNFVYSQALNCEANV